MSTKFRQNLRWVSILRVDLAWNDPHALSILHDGVVRLLYMIRMSAREDVGRAKTVFSPPVLSMYVKSLRSYKINNS